MNSEAHLDWLPNLDSNSGPLSSNQPSLDLPFQRWFKFKEAFSPQLIVDCVRELATPPRTCIDPFGGSGTTALTGQFLGIEPTTVEVNPFLCDLIEAKLSQHEPNSLKNDYFEVLAKSEMLFRSEAGLLPAGPATLVEPGKAGRWIYLKETARRILAVRDAIESLQTPKNKAVLRVALGATLVGLSNVIVNGKGRKYRRNWETKQKTAADVEAGFRASFFTIFSDICRFKTRKNAKFTLFRGDARIALEQCEEFDFAILSPPYPNSFDYTDIYNLELWMLGYFRSWHDNFQLRNQTLRSHVQILRDFPVQLDGSKSLKRTYSRLCKVRGRLWSPHIPEMICAYFQDMAVILTKLRIKRAKRAKVFLAVGNSKYAGILIQTESILIELALANGFRAATSRPFRSMRASPQQGGRHELVETLITLQ